MGCSSTELIGEASDHGRKPALKRRENVSKLHKIRPELRKNRPEIPT